MEKFSFLPLIRGAFKFHEQINVHGKKIQNFECK